MSFSKGIKVFVLSIALLVSISSVVLAVEASEVQQTPKPIINSVVEPTSVDPTIQQRMNDLENRVNNFDMRISDMQTQVNNTNNRTGFGLVSFLFGAFCALWAQNTRRSALGWFIGGLLFNVIAVLILLWHNYNDQNQPPYSVS